MTAAIIWAALLSGSPALGISPYDDILVQQALKDLEQGAYEEALEALTQAWEKGTKTPEKAFYLGVVYRRMLDYNKSRHYLEEALRLKPNYPEARRLLADTLLALDKVDDALVQLKELERTGYQPGQTAFLLGMAAVKQKRYSEALDYFRKAQQDPAVAQDAKFQMSMVLATQNRLKEARKTLDEVVIMAPQTDTATFAQRYAAAIDQRLKEIRPFRFYGSFSMDFDSNVTVQPGDPAAAAQVSGQGDMAYTYSGAFEYNLFATQPYSILAQYAYSQTLHPRITSYDTLNHAWAIVPGYKFEKSRFWVPLNYYYTDLENDKYYTAYAGSPTYLHLVTPNLGLEVGGRLSKRYYWFPVALPQDNRTGVNTGGSLGMYYFFKNQEGYLQARIIYEHDFAQGSNWSNSAYRLFLLAFVPVTPRLKVSSFVDLILQPYDHQNVAFNQFGVLVVNPKRRDKTLIYGINATYAVYKGLEFNVHYYLVRDNSNLALYDYYRHIIGCQFGYRY
jgi:tetratricopeptide (TPR) repeat protein